MNVAERLAEVRSAISRSCRDAGRDAAGVQLVAVSKTFEAEHIMPAIEAGQRLFGENRVQEAKGKWPALKARFPDIELHLIGPLQTNKAREALALFDVIHTVDRESLAATLSKEIARLEDRSPPRLLIQVNTGEEPQKAGIPPEEADAFIARCREVHKLAIEGLMCIPPVDEPVAPHFGLLASIAKRNGLKALSMGMSGDYEKAIALGATYIRVGSAIFGAR
jgi:pyridoxal phosphate enzyme (YggS family)